MKKISMFLNNNRPWLYLLEHVVIGILLVVVVLLINIGIFPLIDSIPDLFLTSQSLAETILSTLAGAWLTIMTFTFSITMVVLTTYSSNYSPRVVENFLQRKTTMKVLGTFIGGFVFCVTALFFLNDSFAADRVLSASVAIMYAFWCIVQFIIFIFSVADGVQVQNLIAVLYDDANKQIEDYILKEECSRIDDYDTARFSHHSAMVATKNGYLVEVERHGFTFHMQARPFRLILNKQIGDFVSAGTTIADCFYDGDKLRANETEQLSHCFNLAAKRYAILDYRYAIKKMVDVCLKALSSGINDPNTAIMCIHSLGILTGKMARIDGRYDRYLLDQDSKTDIRADLIIENHHFEQDVYETYSQIVYYGRSDASVCRALLDAFLGVAIEATQKNRLHLLSMADYVMAHSAMTSMQAVDQTYLNKARSNLSQLVIEQEG